MWTIWHRVLLGILGILPHKSVHTLIKIVANHPCVRYPSCVMYHKVKTYVSYRKNIAIVHGGIIYRFLVAISVPCYIMEYPPLPDHRGLNDKMTNGMDIALAISRGLWTRGPLSLIGIINVWPLSVGRTSIAYAQNHKYVFINIFSQIHSKVNSSCICK